MKGTKERNISLILMLISMVYVWSGTGLMGFAIILFYVFLAQGKKIEKIFDIKILTLVYAVLYYLVVIVRVQERVSTIIVNFLGKDVTFTGRTTLWDLAIYYFLKSPLYGYGVTEKFLVAQSGIAYSPHNLFLQIALAGGVLSLACFLVMYLFCNKKLDYKKYFHSNLIATCIFVYLVVSLTESTMNTQYLYFLFILAANISKFNENQKKERLHEAT